MDFQAMLRQLESKTKTVQQLRTKISTQFTYLHSRKQLLQHLHSDLKPSIIASLAQYNQHQINTFKEMHTYYQREMTKIKIRYEADIQELQSELGKQYKLIGSLKQQLEDLSYLVNEQLTDKQSSNDSSLNSSLKSGQYPQINYSHSILQSSNSSAQPSLEIILEEDTEMTILSSSRQHHNANFIRIEQQQSLEPYGEGYQYQSSDTPADSQDKIITDAECKLTVEQIILDCDMCLSQSCQEQGDEHDMKAKQFISIPMSKQNNINVESSNFLADITNIKKKQPFKQLSENVHVTPAEMASYREPKTKQFLQEFRKTFNKCLSSMHINKKYSNKVNQKIIQSNNNSSEKPDTRSEKTKLNGPPMQITFGKGKKAAENSRSFFIKDKQDNAMNEPIKEDFSKIVSAMLKERDQGLFSKFLVGDKKLQLKYQGDKKSNIRDGNGTIFYSNGLCFQGEFKNGVRCGYGILKFNHIEIYNGDWKDDEICGQGKIRNCAIINKRKSLQKDCPLSRWISYCGEFKSSRFEGEGTLYLQGGQKFLGKFIGGMACGQGTLYKKNGQIESGIWKNNILVKRF